MKHFPTVGIMPTAHSSDFRTIYVHVPKAGGTSIWEALSTRIGVNRSMICALDSLTDPRTLLYVDPLQWELDASDYARNLPPAVKYIQGHFPATRFMGRTDAFFFTWLRHPYQRALSHYFFWRTLPSEGHYLHDYIKSNNLPFEHFIELPMMHNLVSRFFPNDSFWKLDFFGFQETFDTDWKDLCYRLGFTPSTPGTLRPTNYPDEFYRILKCESTFKRFCKLNKEDMDLFWFAKELRDQQISAGERGLC